jgi:pre-mRNA-splicing factor SPF27
MSSVSAIHPYFQHSRLEDLMAETKAAVEAVNRERKLTQTQVQRELQGYETQWAAAILKNSEIEAACRKLEAELAQLRAQLPAQCAPRCF